MDGSGIEAREQKYPDLLNSRVGSCGFSMADEEVSEDVDATMVEWWGAVEALFW